MRERAICGNKLERGWRGPESPDRTTNAEIAVGTDARGGIDFQTMIERGPSTPTRYGHRHDYLREGESRTDRNWQRFGTYRNHADAENGTVASQSP